MPPLNYEIRLTGTSDDADPERVRDAFTKVVRALRGAIHDPAMGAAPITVSGFLSGRVEAYRDTAGQLFPVEPLSLNAADVDAPRVVGASRTALDAADAGRLAHAEVAGTTHDGRTVEASRSVAQPVQPVPGTEVPLTHARDAADAKADAAKDAKAAKAASKEPASPAAGVTGGGVKVVSTTTTTATPVKKEA